MTVATTSPFKYLDAYQKEDADRFFGRERETAQLYNGVHASNLAGSCPGSGGIGDRLGGTAGGRVSSLPA